jgi:hypothetical protein
MVCEYSVVEIKRRVGVALGMLMKNDSSLLKLRVNERAIAHKLAEYLQMQFPDWNVDCEYNKMGDLPKELDDIAGCDEHKRNNRIYPDIIVHLRNQERNLLVIELKKEGLNSDCDIKKLELLTAANGEYCYSLGLFIQSSGSNLISRWFKNGLELRSALKGEALHRNSSPHE